MRTLRGFVAFAVVVVGVVSTVGSGGGSGYDVNGPTGPPSIQPPPAVDITTANAQDVAATVVQDVDQVFDFAGTIGGQIFPSLPSAPDLLSSNSKFELFETAVATGAPATGACAVSGAVTVSGDPGNNPVSLSVQDAFHLVFDTCDDGDGYSLDGSFSAIVTQLGGDPRTDVFGLSYDVQTVTVTVAFDDDTQMTASGCCFSLTWDSLGFPVTVLSLSPYAVVLSTQADEYSLFGGVYSRTVNADISVSTTLAEVGEATLQSHASLDGYVKYETVVPLQAPDGQDPASGEILISETAANGTIRIVIESSASVRLDIDADGDGTVDDTQYTTWAALLG